MTQPMGLEPGKVDGKICVSNVNTMVFYISLRVAQGPTGPTGHLHLFSWSDCRGDYY